MLPAIIAGVRLGSNGSGPEYSMPTGLTQETGDNWPVAMTLDKNLEDLVRHAKDFHERKGFTYRSS
jgi:hypothetical protein